MRPIFAWTLAIALIGFGILFCIDFASDRGWQRNAIHLRGTVRTASAVPSYKARVLTSYSATIEYTYAGSSHSFEAHLQAPRLAPVVPGQSVELLVAADNPADVKPFTSLWTQLYTNLIPSLILCAIGGLIIYVRSRPARTQAFARGWEHFKRRAVLPLTASLIAGGCLMLITNSLVPIPEGVFFLLPLPLLITAIRSRHG